MWSKYFKVTYMSKINVLSFFLIIFIQLLMSCVSSQDWIQHTIDNTSTGADGVKLGDINNDGLIDITTGWEEGGITKLYLHPGVENVKSAWPSVIVGQTPKVEDAVFVDMNADGILDIVSATEKNVEKIFVHFAPETGLLHPSNWQQAILPTSDGVMMWMFIEPLQVDGRNGMDLVAAGKGKKAKLGWFEAPEAPSKLEDWNWHPISSMGWGMSTILRDLDADGDIDIIVTDRNGDMRGCRWLENPSDPVAQKREWTSHFIGAEGLEVMFMTMADMDGDGLEEAVLTERSTQTIRIYKKEDKTGLSWSENVINVPSTTGNCKSVEVGDINNDGIMDIVLSTNTDEDAKVGLSWLDGRRISNTNASDFKPISGTHKAKYDKVELLDIDLDGDLDVLICEENYGHNSEGLGVIWYENRTIK